MWLTFTSKKLNGKAEVSDTDILSENKTEFSAKIRRT